MKLIAQHTVISILVKDQEDALRFYTETLGLEKRSDMSFGPGRRLLTVASKGQQKPELALAQPDHTLYDEEHIQELMSQRMPAFVFATDNCCAEYEVLQSRGVNFVRAPSMQLYGVEAVFTDPYGNTFSLLEATQETLALFASTNVHTAA